MKFSHFSIIIQFYPNFRNIKDIKGKKSENEKERKEIERQDKILDCHSSCL